MEIADTSAHYKVTIKLDFLKPLAGHNTAEFTLEAGGDSTSVTWAIHGPQPANRKAVAGKQSDAWEPDGQIVSN